MNLRDLEYLVALDEHRHFGRAAAACYVSQPTLSTQVKKLETELGLPLVERGVRRVLLTPAGEQVAARARIMLDEAAEIRVLADRARNPRSGTLRLGIFPTLAPYLLPHVVPTLKRRFPDIELRLVEERSPELLDQLRAGRLDAAALALPVADDSLHGEPLFREDFLMAVPDGHQLTQLHRPLRPADLAGEPLLLLEDGHCLRDQTVALCRVSGAIEHQEFQATSLETLRHMVAAGAGSTLLPAMSVSPPVAPAPGLRLLPFAAPAPHRDIALFRRGSSAVAELVRDVASVLRNPPGAAVTPWQPKTSG